MCVCLQLATVCARESVSVYVQKCGLVYRSLLTVFVPRQSAQHSPRHRLTAHSIHWFNFLSITSHSLPFAAVIQFTVKNAQTRSIDFNHFTFQSVPLAWPKRNDENRMRKKKKTKRKKKYCVCTRVWRVHLPAKWFDIQKRGAHCTQCTAHAYRNGFWLSNRICNSEIKWNERKGLNNWVRNVMIKSVQKTKHQLHIK